MFQIHIYFQRIANLIVGEGIRRSRFFMGDADSDPRYFKFGESEFAAPVSRIRKYDTNAKQQLKATTQTTVIWLKIIHSPFTFLNTSRLRPETVTPLLVAW